MRKVLFLVLMSCVVSAYAQTTYYVATNGTSGNNGLSPENPIDLVSGFQRATTQGDIVYIKKGTYNRSSQYTISQSGTSDNPIQFIGYNVTPGDIVSVPHSSITYGQTMAQTNMPIIARSGGSVDTNGLIINGDHLVFKNILLTAFNFGWIVGGDYNVFDNIAFFELGPQTGDIYKGYGIRVNGNNNAVKNSYGENVSAEAFLTRGNNNLFKDNEYRNDNTGAMTDYYMTVRGTSDGNGNFNLFEGNKIYRIHNGSHGGHGYDVKSGNNNIFRENYAFRTKLELNFSDTFDNLFQRNFLEGTNARIHISNGAHDNTFDGNILIDGGYQGINGFMYDDGSTGPPIDCNCIGDNNIFVNNIIEGSVKAIQMQEDGSDIVGSTPVKGWVFKNNLFIGQTLGGFRTNIDAEDFVWENNIWMNQSGASAARNYGSGSTGTNMTSNRENYFNNSFATPSGAGFTNITSFNPLFVNAGANDYKLQTGSPLRNIGATTSYPTDADGTPRPQGSGWDIGPYEYFTGETPPEDTTPPVVSVSEIENVDFTSFRVAWTLNEGSKGRIYFDTNPGTNIADYPNFTNIENSFLTFHRQTVGGSNPAPLTEGTTYYFRFYLEDVNGNIGLSPEYTVTTLGEEAPEPEDTTAPSVVGTPVISNVTNSSFTIEWSLDEGGRGRVYVGTSTGTEIADYTYFSALESNYISFHRQTVGPTNGNPITLADGTTYYMRIWSEDVNGNSRLSPEYTVTTLANEGEIPDPPPAIGSIQDLRGLFLKIKKF